MPAISGIHCKYTHRDDVGEARPDLGVYDLPDEAMICAGLSAERGFVLKPLWRRFLPLMVIFFKC
jgi:hypothetical protein